MLVNPPIKGFSEGFNVEDSPREYSGYQNNVRPISTLSGRLILCQRPGWEKKYVQQIGGVAGPVVAACSVTVVT